MVPREGFEPSRRLTLEFEASASTSSATRAFGDVFGAIDGVRTRDLRIDNPLLYQLSYNRMYDVIWVSTPFRNKVPLNFLARLTGLEPATSGVTGRRSNQLSYNRIVEHMLNTCGL